jgi:hypothetical protein
MYVDGVDDIDDEMEAAALSKAKELEDRGKSASMCYSSSKSFVSTVVVDDERSITLLYVLL